MCRCNIPVFFFKRAAVCLLSILWKKNNKSQLKNYCHILFLKLLILLTDFGVLLPQFIYPNRAS